VMERCKRLQGGSTKGEKKVQQGDRREGAITVQCWCRKGARRELGGWRDSARRVQGGCRESARGLQRGARVQGIYRVKGGCRRKREGRGERRKGKGRRGYRRKRVQGRCNKLEGVQLWMHARYLIIK